MMGRDDILRPIGDLQDMMIMLIGRIVPDHLADCNPDGRGIEVSIVFQADYIRIENILIRGGERLITEP